MENSKYKLFAGNDYYPSGGYDDFIGSFIDIDTAKKNIETEFYYQDWAHIVLNDKIVIIGRSRANLQKPYWQWIDNYQE